MVNELVKKMLKLSPLDVNQFYSKIKTYGDFKKFLKDNNLSGPDEIFCRNFTLFSWISDSETLKNYHLTKNLSDSELNTNEYDRVRLLRFTTRHPKFDINHLMNEYFNNTALMVNISNSERHESLALIDDFNANPFIPDNHGKNTLHLLIAKARKEDNKMSECDNMMPVFEKILQHKNITKHINDKDENGNTTLHIARRDLDYTIPLIQAGANLNIKNNNGLSVIDMLKSDAEVRMKNLRTILSPWNDDKLYVTKDTKDINHPIENAWKEIYKHLLANKLKTDQEISDAKKNHLEDSSCSIAFFDSKTFNQNPDLVLEEINKNLPNKNLNSFKGKGKCNVL